MKKQRLVSAPSLVEHVKEYHEHIKRIRNPRATKQNLAQDAIILDCIGIIESEPSEDEREIGEWQYTDDMYETLICSVCGYDTEDYVKHNFCPNCGAYMKGADNEGD